MLSECVRMVARDKRLHHSRDGGASDMAGTLMTLILLNGEDRQRLTVIARVDHEVLRSAETDLGGLIDVASSVAQANDVCPPDGRGGRWWRNRAALPSGWGPGRG